MKKYGVASPLSTNEIFLHFETDTVEVQFSTLWAKSPADGWYFVILRDNDGQPIEIMRMVDESTKDCKIFRSTVEHYAGTFEFEVVIVPSIGMWEVHVK